MLIAFEGIDGSGKTSLARCLVDRALARGDRARYIDRRGLPALADGPRAQLRGLRDAIWPPQHEQTEDPFGTHFSLYALAAWYSALARHAIPQDRHELVVIDGWYHRVIIKAALRAGLDRSWLHSLFAHIPDPDRVVLVDLPPELSYARRSTFSASECGRWDGHRSEDPRHDFIAYQTRVRSELLTMANQLHWLVVSQRGESPEQLAGWIEAHL